MTSCLCGALVAMAGDVNLFFTDMTDAHAGEISVSSFNTRTDLLLLSYLLLVRSTDSFNVVLLPSHYRPDTHDIYKHLCICR